MTKTPYELRYELLMMAQGILNEQSVNLRIKIENDWNMSCDRARSIASITNTTPEYPAFPNVPCISEEMIIDTAKKLNIFVSNGE